MARRQKRLTKKILNSNYSHLFRQMAFVQFLLLNFFPPSERRRMMSCARIKESARDARIHGRLDWKRAERKRNAPIHRGYVPTRIG